MLTERTNERRHGSGVSGLEYLFCLGLIRFGLNTVEWRKQRSQTGSQDARQLSYPRVFFGLNPCQPPSLTYTARPAPVIIPFATSGLNILSTETSI